MGSWILIVLLALFVMVMSFLPAINRYDDPLDILKASLLKECLYPKEGVVYTVYPKLEKIIMTKEISK